ncbi:MAG TPA: panthothenate synthetase [Terriglobia bacterium]|nr:panthothenate synthetase [Terriglobia bacterium]
MRVILHAKFPHEKFNQLVRDGSVGKKMKRILEELKPEATYFTEYHGHRSALLVLNLEDASQLPSLAEPWFLTFDADCEFRVAMTPEDLAKSGLDELGKKWA